jgi:hypothetical protein
MRGAKLLLAFLVLSTIGRAQYVQPMGYRHYSFPWYVNIGNGSVKVTDTSAYLEIGPRTGASKGLLPPRLTQTERANIPSPKDGLLIFNKTTRKYNWYDTTCSCWRDLLGSIPPPTDDSTLIYWAINGNHIGVTPSGYGIGPNSVDHLPFKTSGITRMAIPDTGLGRQSGGSWKYMMFDTSGKWLGYGDASNTTPDLQTVTDVGNTTTHPLTIGSYIAIGDTGYGGSYHAYLQDYFGTLRWSSPTTHPNMLWTLNGTNHSAARNYTLPDKSGTLALLDDISGTNIYNGNGKTTSNRIDSLDGHSLLFFGTSTNYPDPAVDSFKVANAATLFTNSLVTKRLTDVIVGGVNYGSYQNTDYAGSIFFRHYGAYATGCDICGKNTMSLKWTQNAAWDPVTASGGVDTLLHTMGAHNGPGDHHFFLGDLTDTYSNVNRYITIEHNGAPFVGFYNNPVGNFAQSLFGSSYSAIPNWENWHTIIGGKLAVKDTAGLFGAVKAPNLPTGKKAKQLYWDTDGNIYVGDSTGTGGGGSGTVTSFTFSDGNGFDGTVTNSTTTPTLSLTTTATDKAVMYSNSGAITGSSNMSQQTGFIRIGATGSAAPLQIFHHEDIGFGPLQLWYGSGDDTILQARADTSIWMRSEDSEFPSSVIPNTGWGKFYVRKDSARFMNYSGQEFTIGRSSGSGGWGVSGSVATLTADAYLNQNGFNWKIGNNNVTWSQYGDLTIDDRVTTYRYGGDARGGWHPTQGGYMISPGWGYCFTNANNFNTIDASFQRIGTSQVKLFDAGLSATGSAALTVGSFSVGYVSKAVDYTASIITDNVIEVTATGKTITLPTAVGISGRQYTIKLTASGSGTVATTSSQTIDGSSTYSLASQYKYVTVTSNGSNWIVTANN